MDIRYFIDQETDEPHIYRHGVDESEGEDVLADLSRIGLAEKARGSRSADAIGPLPAGDLRP